MIPAKNIILLALLNLFEIYRDYVINPAVMMKSKGWFYYYYYYYFRSCLEFVVGFLVVLGFFK